MNARPSGYAATLLLLLAGSAALSAPAERPKVTVHVRATKQDYRQTPVSVWLPDGAPKLERGKQWTLKSADGKSALPAQVSLEAGQAYLRFWLDELPKGAERAFTLEQVSAEAKHRVEVNEGDAEITLNGELFTRYATHLGPNKPFLYPILMPGGVSMTRHYPMKQDVPGETKDHPHHRGLWFTHGDVNGIDFWSEEKGAGKTVHTAYEATESGAVFAGFTAKTEWRSLQDQRIATDTRIVRAYALPNGDRMLDFEIAIKPSGAPVKFGDTKEGMFGLRLPDVLAPSRKQGGQSVNSEGLKDAALWGKKATWVDYWGTLNGATYGVAIFDHPGNLRHPQTWHARDYGLFTINPFGLHDFGMGEKGVGDYLLAEKETLTLRYRVFFHKGDTATASVAAQAAAYLNPPEAQVK